MTSLIRCRGSLSELKARFAAETDEPLLWRPTIWPGEPVVVLRHDRDRRKLLTMRWSLPRSDDRRAPNGALFLSELASWRKPLVGQPALKPCAILLESFAYPGGNMGRQTRCWAGLWDEPIAAWAAYFADDDNEEPGCAGFLILANEYLESASRHMPRLLRGADLERWLVGSAGPLSLGLPYDVADYYLERTDEKWSTGHPLDVDDPVASYRNHMRVRSNPKP